LIQGYLRTFIDFEKIDADSVDGCTDESVMEILESTQELDASIIAEFVKAEVLEKVTFAMSENDPTLCVMKAAADYYSLQRNLRLAFISGKPKNAVEHLVSVIKQATLNTLESKLEMDKSDLKKYFLEFVAYLEKLAIIHDENGHVVEHKKTGDSGMKNTGNASDRDRTKSGHGKSSDSTGTGSSQSGSAALPQHEDVCRREALFVRLVSHE
jgi:hypothetical protein